MIEKIFTKIDEIISEIYFNHIHKFLPKKIRIIISGNVILFRYLILHRLECFHLSVIILIGKNKVDGSNLKILLFYLKSKASYQFFTEDFIIEELFEKVTERQRIGNVFIWNINKIIKKYSSNVDAIFIKTDRFFRRWLQKKSFLVIPEVVDMDSDLSGPVENVLKKFHGSAKEDVRRIKKYEYIYEVTNDPKKIDFYYQKLFIPYTKLKHNRVIKPDTAYYNEIRSLFECGNTMLFKDKDKYISGVHLRHNPYKKKNKVSMLCVGINIDYDYVSKRAGACIYYFPILWAKKNNFSKIAWGATPSLLDNGIYRYKRKWGPEIKKSSGITRIIGVKFTNGSKNIGLLNFFENNPLIYMDNTELRGFVYMNSPVNINDVEHIYKKYFTPGMTNLVIISPYNYQESFKELVSLKYKDKIVILDNIKRLIDTKKS